MTMTASDPAAHILPGEAESSPATQASYARTMVLMDTFVTIQVVGGTRQAGCAAAVERAFDWFRRVEDACSRFDPRSEVMQLLGFVGKPSPASDILYQAVAFALAVAQASGGAFDPTIGHTLEQRGFDRHYQTGATIATPIPPDARPNFRDVRLDPERRTITLRRPL